MHVERLTPERRDDYIRFFDRLRDVAGDALCDAARCYCHYFHLAAAIPWDSLDANANRVAMSARIDAGEMEGFLGYRDGEVTGWLNAQAFHKLAHLGSRLAIPVVEHDVPAHEAAAVVCFVIDPSCQQHEAQRALLAAALESFSHRGIRVVDAFPRKADQRSRSRHPAN